MVIDIEVCFAAQLPVYIVVSDNQKQHEIHNKWYLFVCLLGFFLFLRTYVRTYIRFFFCGGVMTDRRWSSCFPCCCLSTLSDDKTNAEMITNRVIASRTYPGQSWKKKTCLPSSHIKAYRLIASHTQHSHERKHTSLPYYLLKAYRWGCGRHLLWAN